MFFLGFPAVVNHEETRVMGLSSSEESMIVVYVIVAQCQRVTDRRQTDRWTDRFAIASTALCWRAAKKTEMTYAWCSESVLSPPHMTAIARDISAFYQECDQSQCTVLSVIIINILYKVIHIQFVNKMQQCVNFTARCTIMPFPFFLVVAYSKNGWTDFHDVYLKRRGFAQGCAFWGSRWRKIMLNGHNFATYERICTKFDTDTENKVLGQLLPSVLVSDKVQDGGGRHFEIR